MKSHDAHSGGVCDHCWLPRDASLRLHNFPERISAFRRAADDRQNHPAVVRRIGRGMEHLPAVFPSRVTCRLLLCRPLHALAETEAAGYAAYRSDGLQSGAASRPAVADLEAVPRGRSLSAHFAAAHCNHRAALLIALHHQPVTPSLVRGGETRRDSVSTVRAVELRFAAGVAELSGIRRTSASPLMGRLLDGLASTLRSS